MNWRKKITAAALAVCLLLPGCSTKNPGGSESGRGKDSPMGRYVESEIPLPGEEGTPLALFLDHEESLQYFFYRTSEGNEKKDAPWFHGISHYQKKADGDWEQQDTGWFDELSKVLGNVMGIDTITMGQDGTLFLIARSEDYMPHLFQIEKGGSPVEIPIALWQEESKEEGENLVFRFGDTQTATEGGSATVETSGEKEGEEGTPKQEKPVKRLVGMEVNIGQMTVLESEDILISYQDREATSHNPKTGDIVKRYGVGDAIVAGDKIYFRSFMEQKLNVYKTGDGSYLESLSAEGMGFDSQLLGDSNGNLYLVDSKGVQSLVSGGSVWENIMEGSMYAMGMPSFFTPLKAVRTSDGDFYVLYQGQEQGNTLYRYHYDANTPSVPDTELVVFSLYDNLTVRQAIGEFQRKYPNVVVNLRIGIDEESAATVTDVIKSLNTELLGGKGPDILILDGLPLDSYIEKGVLADLNSLLEGEKGNLFANIIAPFQRDGKTYAVPARFTVPLIYSSEELLAKMNSLTDIATLSEEAGDRKLLQVYDPSELLEGLYASSSNSFFDANGSLNREALTNFLQGVKRIYEANHPDDQKSVGMAISVTGTALPCMLVLNSSVMGYYMQETNAAIQNAVGFFSYLLPSPVRTSNEEDDRVDGKAGSVKPMVGGEPTFTAGAVAGINAAGKQQELAGEFVRTLLSHSVQSYNFNDGFPVRQESFQKGLDSVKKENHFPVDLLSLVQNLNTVVNDDRVVMENILKEGNSFLMGEKSLEEAVNAILSATQIYLAE